MSRPWPNAFVTAHGRLARTYAKLPDPSITPSEIGQVVAAVAALGVVVAEGFLHLARVFEDSRDLADDEPETDDVMSEKHQPPKGESP